MKFTALIDHVLSLSKADDCIVIGYDYATANLRWANNSTTTNGVAASRDLVIISIKDKRVGVVSKSYFPDDKLEAMVRESEAACAHQQPAEDYMPLIDGESAGWADIETKTGIEVFSRLTPELAKLFKQASGQDYKLFGYAEHSTATVYLANSRGLRRVHQQHKGQIELNAKSADFARSVWSGQATLDFTDVDLAKHWNRLEQKLEWSKNRIELPAGKYETIIEPSAVADMLIYQYWTSVARDADEGRTVFSKPGGGNKVGQQLFPKSVSIYSDPAEPNLACEPFELVVASHSGGSLFDNGLALARTDWVKDGVVSNLITPRFWAEQSKTEPKPGIGNLIFPSDGPELEAMIKSTKRGLLVTCFWYIREVDPQSLLLTGLTRDGVFLIEDGVVKGAVNNFRFNMSPLDMLAQTTEIGRSAPTLAREWGDYFTLTKMPPLRVKDFNMSSVSKST